MDLVVRFKNLFCYFGVQVGQALESAVLRHLSMERVVLALDLLDEGLFTVEVGS